MPDNHDYVNQSETKGVTVRTLATGAELARFRFVEPEPEVDIEFQPMFDFALGNRPQPRGIELRHAAGYVEGEVLLRFERLVTLT
jgi:hypothetical protein